jgi:hypothetical protein
MDRDHNLRNHVRPSITLERNYDNRKGLVKPELEMLDLVSVCPTVCFDNRVQANK